MQKLIFRTLLGAALIGCFCLPAGATEKSLQTEHISIQTLNMIEHRASGAFDLTIKSGMRAVADQAFPMEAGETVTIKASYTPMSASVDVGLIDSDGVYYYFNVKNGSINKTIQIEERGNYKFAIRNNSEATILVSGYVNY